MCAMFPYDAVCVGTQSIISVDEHYLYCFAFRVEFQIKKVLMSFAYCLVYLNKYKYNIFVPPRSTVFPPVDKMHTNICMLKSHYQK